MPSRDFKRTDRVGAELRRELGLLVHAAVRDHALPSVSVSDVEITRDMEWATVWITALLAQVGEIAASASKVVAGLDSSIALVNGVIGSPEFRQNITSTMNNLEQASGDARQLVTANRAAINRAIGNLDRLSGDLRDLVNTTRPAVERTLASAQDISADAKAALRSVDTTLRQANVLIGHLDTLAADIKGGDGAVHKILYDKAFADELQRTLESVRSLVQSVEKGGIKTKISIFGN